MARVFTIAPASGVLATEFTSVSASNVTADTSVKRSGPYSVKLNANAVYARKTLPTALSEFYLHVAVYLGGTASYAFLEFQDNANNQLNSLQYRSDGKIYVLSGSTALTGSNSAFSTGTWLDVEVYFKVGDSPNGRFVVKVNGTTEIDYTGDTKPGSVTAVSVVGLYAATGMTPWYACDFVLNDTTDPGDGSNMSWPGTIQIKVVVPSGTGTYAEQSRGGTDSGNNWDQCDEQPADGVEYVYHATTGKRDTYAMGNVSMPSNSTIQNVVVQTRSQIDSGSGNIIPMMRSGSTDSEGATLVLSTAWAAKQHCWSKNPDGSVAWTESAVNALEAGCKTG